MLQHSRFKHGRLKKSILKQAYAVAIFVLGAAALCAAQSDSPSLADLARKSRSQKQSAATLTTVHLTEDNFVRRAPVESKSVASTSVAGSMPSAGDQQSDAAGASAKPVAGNEKSTKAEDLKKEELKKQLDSYKATRDAWNKSAKRYEDLMANETDEFRRRMYQDALDNDRGNVALYQKKIDQAEAAAKPNADENASEPDQKTSAGGNKP
jgi:Tfp pilus assembly protein PilW